MKIFEVLWEYQNVTQNMKWANAVEKIVQMDMLLAVLPQTFNLKKKICKAQ